MNKIKRLFANAETKAVLGVLDEVAVKHENPAFEIVRTVIETRVLRDQGKMAELVRGGTDPRTWTLGAICNIAGDEAASGRWHVHRGLLSPMPGEQLVAIFDCCIDELHKIGKISSKDAKEEKKGLREQIAEVG